MAGERAADVGGEERDWTCDDMGRSNSSSEFLALVSAVEGLIRVEAASLMAGRADATARLIVAQLAHRHGVMPVGDGGEVTDERATEEWCRLALHYRERREEAEAERSALREALEEIASREPVVMHGEGNDRVGVIRSYSEAVEIARAALAFTQPEEGRPSGEERNGGNDGEAPGEGVGPVDDNQQ